MKVFRNRLVGNYEKFYSGKMYLPYLGYDHMVYEQTNKFFWCPVQKAPSSS